MDSLNLAPTPVDEPCAQVGSSDYAQQSRIEIRVFKDQLYRLLSREYGDDIHVRLVVVGHPHDFGMYRDVEVKFDENSRIAVEQAFWLESNLPENWDQEAKDQLTQLGYEVQS